jgi:hypothetical protein
MYWAIFIMDDGHSAGLDSEANDSFACPLGYQGTGSVPEKAVCGGKGQKNKNKKSKRNMNRNKKNKMTRHDKTRQT